MDKGVQMVNSVLLWLLKCVGGIVLLWVLVAFYDSVRPGGSNVTWHWWLLNFRWAVAVGVPIVIMVLYWWLVFLRPTQQHAKAELRSEIAIIKENLQQEITGRLAPAPWNDLSGVMTLLTPLFDKNEEESKSLLSFLSHVRKNRGQFGEIERRIRLTGSDFHRLRRMIVTSENWEQIAGEFDSQVLRSIRQVCQELYAEKDNWQRDWHWGVNENGMEQVYGGFVSVWTTFTRDRYHRGQDLPESLKGLLIEGEA